MLTIIWSSPGALRIDVELSGLELSAYLEVSIKSETSVHMKPSIPMLSPTVSGPLPIRRAYYYPNCTKVHNMFVMRCNIPPFKQQGLLWGFVYTSAYASAW